MRTLQGESRTLHFRDVLGIGPIAFCAASGSMMSVLY
jgi:hypothetical protein